MQNFYDLDNDVLDLYEVLERISDLELQIGTDEECADDQDELENLNGFIKALEENFSLSVDRIAEDEPTVVNASYWIDYVKQLADDLGLLAGDDYLAWPYSHIDWQAAADDMEQDYLRFNYKYNEYLIRAY